MQTSNHLLEAARENFICCKISKALIYVEKFLKLYPLNLEGLLLKAECYSELQIYDISINILKKALEIKPKNLKTYMLLSDNYAQINKYHTAINYLNYALEIVPLSTVALYNKAIYYMKLRSFNLALKILNKIITINPNNYEYYLQRGICLEKLGRLEEAHLEIKKCFSLPSDDIACFIELSTILFKQGKYKECLKINETILSKNPYYTDAYFNISACLINLNNIDKAIECLTERLKIKKDINYYFQRGICYMKKGNYSLALKDFSGVNTVGHFNEKVLYMYCLCLSELKKYKEADDNFQLLIHINPININYYQIYGNMLKKMGNKKKAEKIFKQMEKIKESEYYEN